ncbi:hypothetical protein PIB30_086868 [Stylosanthes scabra]|uniref:Uncharacterized protein n=1 Tax=Stylosanthes scabra TaxID=79078 RepID=A0ABU6TTV2_9FABA|nr:hypothetical protein [Stylosanthes scabra]
MLELEFLQPRPIISTVHPFFYLIVDLHNYRRDSSSSDDSNGKTSTKTSASAAAGFTAGNLSQLLLRSCFRRVPKKNSS